MKRIISIVITSMFLITSIIFPFQQATAQTSSPMHVFVIVGELNAFGKDIVPASQTTDSRIQKWNGSTWVLGQEPTTTGGGYSFGQSFALSLLSTLNDPTYQVGLVGCGVNGTSINDWQRGMNPYNACGISLVTAMSLTPENSRVDGIIFYQGENNTLTVADANSWRSGFTSFVRNFRSDNIGRYVPVFYAQIGKKNTTGTSRPGWETLQTNQAAIQNDMYSDIKMISTSDLPTLSTASVALTASSEDIVGQRFALKYYQYLPQLNPIYGCGD